MIEFINFSKIYDNKKIAVDNLNLTLNNGDLCAFIGHNGAGKTTTIKSLVGIISFEKGDILVNKKSVKTDINEIKKDMAYIPDNPDIYENIKGIDYLNFIADIYKVNSLDRKERIEKYAKEFLILNNLGDRISSYSHGMKQKLVIISALIHNPKILLLDEPFVGLDPEASHILKEHMKKMCENGTIIFFSTHVLEVAEKLCNKVAIINKGELTHIGDMKDIVGNKTLEEIFMENIKND